MKASEAIQVIFDECQRRSKAMNERTYRKRTNAKFE